MPSPAAADQRTTDDNPSPTQPDLRAALHEVFGFDEFRAHQQEAVAAAMEGRDLLVVMPTGAGKSLCFQLPAALSDGVSLVISPLVALMRDQVGALRSRTSFNQLGAAYLNSLQSPEEQREVLDMLRNGELKLLYVAPERFRSAAFLGVLSGVKLARFVVDEAHCISEWGHDFRPDYLAMKGVVEMLGRPPILAVTATATVRVQQSIIDNLGMRDPLKLVGGFNRPNLHFSVHRCKSDKERLEMLFKALPKLARMGGSGLIYAATRKGCEEVAEVANRALAPLGLEAAAYHAGLDPVSRNNLQARWLTGELHTLVATNAFGMGIDKPDVRFVVHYVYPESLESYYQEAGRAGRDGRKSRCVILYNFADRRTREWFIENDELTAEDVHTAHTQICKATNGENFGMSRGWAQSVLGWNEVKVRLALSELERADLIQRVGESNEETMLKILRRDFPKAALTRITNDLSRRRDERFRRLDEMVGYCKTKQCRRVTTLAYFGDLERPQRLMAGENVFCCDNCEKPKEEAQSEDSSSPVSRNERTAMPIRVEGADIHSILEALDALWPQVGKARLGKLLRGAASKDVQRFKDEGCPLYGILKTASQAQVDKFLGALIDQGLVHQADEEEYFVCRVTRAGREAWQTKAEIDIAVPGAPASRDDLGDSADELFEELRNWRRKQANEENLPPYCILPDRTLLALTQDRPKNETALLMVAGIGPSKSAKYGEAVLKVLRDFEESE